MKVTLITGSYPPDICGVGDYAYHVYHTSTADRENWNLYYPRDGWRLTSFFKKVRQLNRTGADTFILQAPTQGYGWSILPHLLVFYFGWFTRKKMVVRLHEYTQLSRKSRMAVNLMLAGADYVIFTNFYDRKIAASRFSRLQKRSSVVKIFSNVAQAPVIHKREERNTDLINFGQIRSGKGLEIFLETVRLLREQGFTGKAAIIGQVPDGYQSYYENICKQCDVLGVRVYCNLAEPELVELLNDSKIAYLPFPDGISERRGSLLASLYNGVVVITTKGKFTTSELERAVLIEPTTGEASATIQRLLIKDKTTWEQQQNEGFKFLADQIPHSWDEIARQYIQAIK